MKRNLVFMTLPPLFVASFLLFMHTSCSTEIVMRKVSFDSQGGSVLDAVEVIDGQKIDEPVPPTESNYAFDGWYEESECIYKWNFENGVVESGRYGLFNTSNISCSKIYCYIENFLSIEIYTISFNCSKVTNNYKFIANC